MSLPLISFLISLCGIILMVWRELVLVRKGQIETPEHEHPFVPEVQKIKRLTLSSIKKFGYLTIFSLLRFFIKVSSFIKIKSIMLINELKNKLKQNKFFKEETLEKKEVSKYLKIISEYRHKIKEMKHRIKEEEGIE